jgi:hypothetical protein
MKTAEAIATLDADVQVNAVALIAACVAHPLKIALGVHQGYRSWDDQQVDWLKGRDPGTGGIVHPKEVVTYCPPGRSWHQWRRAFDCHIDTFSGDQTPKYVWDGPWDLVETIAASLGLTPGGRWHHPDAPHMEYPAGRTIAAMLSAHPKGLDA